MFTRKQEAKAFGRRRSAADAGTNSVVRASPAAKSVIANDLRIIGQGLKIVGRGVLQVDGHVDGDIEAAEVIIGEQGEVTGMVAGEQIAVRGKVFGMVCARNVILQGLSEVQGDIHHMSFVIEQGAMFEGRSRRAADEAALRSIIEGRSQTVPT